MADKATTSFFRRNGYRPDQTQAQCHAFCRERYPTSTIRELSSQGHCSYTLHLATDGQEKFIIQFRPENHAVDDEVARLARCVYKDLAPQIIRLGVVPLDYYSEEGENKVSSDLIAYYMSLIPGVPLSSSFPSLGYDQRRCLVEEFARVIHVSWLSRLEPGIDEIPKGRIGSSLGPRLEKLAVCLPVRLRGLAAKVSALLPQIESLPWVFTHGDLVLSNIMVSSSSSPTITPHNDHGKIKIEGMVDWAEAEYLPLGMALYFLEELLLVSSPSTTTTTTTFESPPPKGPNTNTRDTNTNTETYINNINNTDNPDNPDNTNNTPNTPNTNTDNTTNIPNKNTLNKNTNTNTKTNNPPAKQTKPKREYHPNAATLRAHFHKTLSTLIPITSPPLQTQIRISALAGILLWHGIAFDDGLLDRVVSDTDERDLDEVGLLDLILPFYSSSFLDLSCLDLLEDG
ncbi:hypothetical protein QBC47DRAFT_391153 [Echria macrotheca]|uniref:Aminoglycoside phosphotransferase domain-containing protein n=1 Tax=Echria macrotheca TaxID=438768 RepID=A0AAJ0B802_9PEZI|nr:hypothetical protein QBC47DRAFT_391153 [Echria macrotheca]